MPGHLYPFPCLNDFSLVSSDSRDGIVYKISEGIIFKAPFSWINATSDLFQEHRESVKTIEGKGRYIPYGVYINLLGLVAWRSKAFQRSSRPVCGDDANMIADEQIETFAIGTCIYEPTMEYPRYPTMSGSKFAALFRMAQFPSTDGESFGMSRRNHPGMLSGKLPFYQIIWYRNWYYI